MQSITKLVLLIYFWLLSAAGSAEIFFTRVNADIVYAADHLQSGQGFTTRREIRAHGNGFSDPSSVQIYTGWRDGYGGSNLTELYVCDELNDEIHRFSIDADGAERTSSFFRYSDNVPCTVFLAYRSSIYLNAGGGIQVYDNTAAAVQSATLTLTETLSQNFSSIRGDGDYVYALNDADEVIRWSISENQVGGDVVTSSALGDAWSYCPRPWNALAVSGGLVYVASGDDAVRNQICVFDARDPNVNLGSLAPLIRKLSGPDLLGIPTSLVASGDDLYIATDDGIAVYDLRAAGPLPPKRRIPIPDINFMWVTEASEPIAPLFELLLEEPVDGTVHSGVGNLRGWAVADDGITKVDIFVDGQLFQSAPYGGVRADVGGAFPDVVGSGESGFSLAYNYGDLEPGVHTILARAETSTGGVLESSSTFTTTRPGQAFIPGVDAVDLSSASCSINQGRSVRIEDITIDGGGPWDAFLEWRPAAQGFVVKDYILNADGI